jgi:hypothetical protein
MRDFEAVMLRHLPDDPDRPKVIFAIQIGGFFDDLRLCLIGKVL